MYDIAIIGAGVVGTFIARELSRYKLKVILIEKNSDVASEATAANGGTIYDGYDAKPNDFRGKLTMRGNELYDSVCNDLGVRFERVGLLVVALRQEDRNKLEDMYNKGVVNVPGLKILDKDEVLVMEPCLSDEVVGALYSPTCGVVYPWELAIALVENAMDNGVKLLLNSEVTNMKKENGVFQLTLNDNIVNARYVINCAGINADKINELLASPSFKIGAKRGQFIVLDKSSGLTKRIISHCKTKGEKEVSVIPTIGGNLLVGPAMESIEDGGANQVTAERLAFIKRSVSKLSDKIPLDQIIQAFAGIKAKAYLSEGNSDFVIEESPEIRGLINVAGINSPGLTCAPAIAEYVTQIVRDIYQAAGEVLVEKVDFTLRRSRMVRFKDLDAQKKAELIKSDVRYGRVICRCETVTEGEIVDAIHRNCGATTLKGVKRRTGSGLGRCQGGFCGPKIVEILAKELGEEMDEVRYDQKNSYILKGTV
ncbi:MAG: NAD(P)/FAD-dependent oxidoreductase [Firmicutes bacterium]|nr:NAD(P)/FAD-dependent oxidoreductase [Bacillota bacterium]